ncbi:MAG: SDR family NAD(P)-dependent oxidoreductase [Gammaproteobacteria bacterium]
MSEFSNMVVVVTGGSSGIGKSIAEVFYKAGAHVVIFGRDLNKLEEMKRALPKILTVSGDVRKICDLDHLYAETQKVFGKIDVLVANAGVAALRKVDDVDEEFFDNIVDIIYKGAYFTVQRAVTHLKEGASVILISSMGCHVGMASHSVYCSAKAAVSMLARNFAADLIDRNIRVNAISPGFTDTPIFDSADAVAELSKTIPIKRFANPNEIADVVYFLASSKGAYFVGADLVIDGGVSSIMGGAVAAHS